MSLESMILEGIRQSSPSRVILFLRELFEAGLREGEDFTGVDFQDAAKWAMAGTLFPYDDGGYYSGRED